MIFQMVMIPAVGALIGWITNVLAIKMIFRPYVPVKIPLTNYYIHGLIPKRREEIAANVGRVIGTELLPFDDVVDKLNDTGLQKKMINSIIQAVGERLDERIPSLVPGPVRKLLYNLIDETLLKEGPSIISKMLREFPNKIKNDIDFAKMIEDKVNNFDLSKLEKIILEVASRELRHIEILGAVLGFLIGLAQALVTIVLFRI